MHFKAAAALSRESSFRGKDSSDEIRGERTPLLSAAPGASDGLDHLGEVGPGGIEGLKGAAAEKVPNIEEVAKGDKVASEDLAETIKAEGGPKP